MIKSKSKISSAILQSHTLPIIEDLQVRVHY